MNDKSDLMRNLFMCLVWVMIIGVVFLVVSNNRSSILVKEFVYVVGAAISMLLLAIWTGLGRPVSISFSPLLPGFYFLLVSYAGLRIITGIGSQLGLMWFWSVFSLGCFILATTIIFTIRERNATIQVLLGATAILSLYAILQKLNINIFPWDILLGQSGRASSSMGNPNLLGSFTAAMVPVGLGFLFNKSWSRPVIIITSAIFVFLAVSALISSGTRGSLIGLCAGSVVFLFYALKTKLIFEKKFQKIVVFLLLISVFLIAVIALLPRITELTDFNSGTFQVRRVIWSGALKAIIAKPITGWGPGTFQLIFPTFRNPMYHLLGVSHNTLHAHCEYLEILSDLGIVGFLLSISFIILFFSAVRNKLKEDIVTLGLVSGFVALLVEAFVSVALRWPPSAFLAAILVSLALVSVERKKAFRLPRPTFIVAIFPVVLITLSAVPLYLKIISSGHSLFVGKTIYLERVESELFRAGSAALTWEQSGNPQSRNEALYYWESASNACSLAIHWCGKSLEVNPDELGAWYALGSAYLTEAQLDVPRNSSLVQALATEGIEPDMERAQQAARLAIAAYDSLISRAPDYAEVHNNLALAYSRVGDVENALKYIRKSYNLYGHRRQDYLEQTRMLSPLSTGTDGWHLLFLNSSKAVNKFVDTSIIRDENTQNRLNSILNENAGFVSFCMFRLPSSTDSLASAFIECSNIIDDSLSGVLSNMLLIQADITAEAIEVIDRYNSGNYDGLLELCRSRIDSTGILLPFHYYVAGMLLAEENDSEALDFLLPLNEFCLIICKSHVAVWPGHGDQFLAAARLAITYRDSVSTEVFLKTVEQMLQLDVYLLSVMILEDEFKNGELSSWIVTELNRFWESIGGPRYSRSKFYEDGMLFAPSGYMGLTEQHFVEAASGCLSDPGMAILGLRFYYRILSSFWWSPIQERERQFQCIIGKIDSCRTHIENLLGYEEAQFITYRAMMEEASATDCYLPNSIKPFLERVRSEIVSGDIRILERI